mmetsp:Transcript_18460/g.36946  ORF Transcript_18460/g.36946 Transcript_18460/m.36946 type:complete len:916 (+) Transcript_18460:1643-4390(+)
MSEQTKGNNPLSSPEQPSEQESVSSHSRARLLDAQRTDEHIREIETDGLIEVDSFGEMPMIKPEGQITTRHRALSEAPFLSPALRKDRKRYGAGSGAFEKSKGPACGLEPQDDDSVVVPLDVCRLSRGGVYIETSLGPVLVGSPSGTLKDILKGKLALPRFLVAPTDAFARTLGMHLGLNLADFEMIALYSHLCGSDCKETPTIICDTVAQSNAMRIALTESLFPQVVNEKVFASDFTTNQSNMKLKMNISEETESLRSRYFAVDRGPLALDDLVAIKSLEEDGEDGIVTFEQNGLTLLISKEEGHGGEVRVKEVQGSGRARKLKVSAIMKLPDSPPSLGPAFEFTPPLFGVTVLGNSNGFDPEGFPTGYIVWVNRRGVLINPPAYCAMRMEVEFGIHPDMIKCVVLTSSHGDVGQGAFQKILQEERIVTHTTKTIFDSFVRKYASLSGLRPKALKSASRFRQVRIGTPIKICAASFEFFYNFDVAPTLGFTVSFGGKTLLFSGGFSFCADTMIELHAEKSISSARRDFMLGLITDRNYDQVFYDAPLGNDASARVFETLGRNLSEDFKAKLLVNHASLVANLPIGLHRGPTGTGNMSTIVFDVETPSYSSARNLIESVEGIMFFKGLSIEHAASLVQIAEVKSFKAGETVMKASCPILFFSIILSGRVDVIYPREEDEGEARDDEKNADEPTGTSEDKVHQWVTGDCFGEEALIAGVSTLNGVTATDVKLLQIAVVDLQWILAGTRVRERIQHCHDMRVLGNSMERVLQSNSLLRSLTRGQKLAFEMNASVEHADAGSFIWSKDDPTDFAILIMEGMAVFPNAVAKLMSGLIKKSGTMMVKREDTRHNYCPEVFGRGAWVGNASDLVETGGVRRNTLKATSSCQFYKIKSRAVADILTANPGLYIALGESEFVL